MNTCQKCERREAIWALQYIASSEPSFSRLGYHYRGFKVTKICDECFQQINDDYQESLAEARTDYADPLN